MSAMHEGWKEQEAALSVEPRRTPERLDGAAERARLEALVQTQVVSRRGLNAAKAVEWLSGVGVKVLSVEITRFAAVVRIAYTPFLHKLFAGDCAWRQQRQEGNTTILTWFALRYGARIEWEEIQCPKN